MIMWLKPIFQTINGSSKSNETEQKKKKKKKWKSEKQRESARLRPAILNLMIRHAVTEP